MNVATLEPDKWPRGRWVLLIALVFVAHLGLLFAFGDRKPVTRRPPASAPLLKLATDSEELLALNDPTLFALPHRESSAGAVWLKSSVVQFQPFRWTEPPRLLPLPVEELGTTFAQFMQTNVLATFELEIKPTPELTTPVVPEIGTTMATRSSLRLGGELAKRRLLNPPELPSLPAADVLPKSVVQVLVNADGKVISPIQLSGSKDAEQNALAAARAARFEPLRNGGTSPTVGLMIIEWHTVPLLKTNPPSTSP